MSGQVVKGYAILDGGGVLGSALAGALTAAEEDIEFVGFGGTSAGSIVATLAAVGYTGDELKSILVETDFTSLLNNGGTPVKKFKSDAYEIIQCLAEENLIRKIMAFGKLRGLAGRLEGVYGIDDGRAIKNFVLSKIRDKWPDRFAGAVDVTFADLAALESQEKTKPRCFPLKIVASDVSRRRPVIFSKDDSSYSGSVLDAVRASTCYPFVFQPFDRNDQVWLVDGGLASNLPVFLFHREQMRTKFPVFAFDLVTERTTRPDRYDLRTFLSDMVSTALEASDDLFRQVLRDVYHIPIKIPTEPRYDVLNFEIDRKSREDLFRLGKEQTRDCLNELKFIQLAREAESMRQGLANFGFGEARIMETILQKQIQARYGDPKLFETILNAVARDMEALTKAKEVRVHVTLLTGRVLAGQPTRIVVYSHGMFSPGSQEPSDDSTLELAQDAGCTGQAWTEGKPVIADLEQAAKDPSRWKMTLAQHRRVPRDRKAMLSVPIWGYPGAEREFGMHPIGTLSIDSSTPLTDTSWMDSSGKVPSVVVERMLLWENVIRRLLP
jgi:NTE family protein